MTVHSVGLLRGLLVVAFSADDYAPLFDAHQSHKSDAASARRIANVTAPAITASSPAVNVEVNIPVAAT